MMNAELFGKRLKAFRDNKGYSQEKLSELSDVSTVTIHKIETNERKPSLALAVKLCVLLEMPFTCFVDDDREVMSLNPDEIDNLKKMSKDDLALLLDLISRF